MDSVVTKAAFARLMGVSRPRVSQWVQWGLPVREDGKLDADPAKKWVENNVLRPEQIQDPPGAKASLALAVRIALTAGARAALSIGYSRKEAEEIGSLVGVTFWGDIERELGYQTAIDSTYLDQFMDAIDSDVGVGAGESG